MKKISYESLSNNDSEKIKGSKYKPYIITGLICNTLNILILVLLFVHPPPGVIFVAIIIAHLTVLLIAGFIANCAALKDAISWHRENINIHKGELIFLIIIGGLFLISLILYIWVVVIAF